MYGYNIIVIIHGIVGQHALISTRMSSDNLLLTPQESIMKLSKGETLCGLSEKASVISMTTGCK